MNDPLRHHDHAHLFLVFGSDTFSAVAESFARFFGTSKFLIGQTLIVAAWITFNALSKSSFDPYPFILLNLAFSLQAAYAAPLILLAQTRQADRDKANTEADAKHREEIAQQSLEMQKNMEILLRQNTDLTQQVKALTEVVHSKITGLEHK